MVLQFSAPIKADQVSDLSILQVLLQISKSSPFICLQSSLEQFGHFTFCSPMASINGDHKDLKRSIRIIPIRS